MSKLPSTNFLYPILMAIAVWIAGVSPAAANQKVSEVQQNAAATTLIADATPAPGNESPANRSSIDPNAAQIERATEATELKPGDWAYQTLQGLHAKYGCGNNTPTDGRTLSREEFATSLNGCVGSMEQLVARRTRKPLKKRRVAPAVVTPPTPEIAPPPPEVTPVQPPTPAPPEVSQQDLDQIKQLIQAFSVELKGIDARLQTLDAKTTALKDQSFSTTTKLVGEAIFALTDVFGDRAAVPSGAAPGARLTNNQAILSNRVRLNFRSSFMGKDLLITRLQARNSNSFSAPGVANTNTVRLGFEGSEENTATLHLLQYQLPISPETKVVFTAVGNELDTYLPNFNPLLAPAGTGAVTRFGRYNSIYRLSAEGAGATIDQKLGQGFSLAVGYAAPRTANAPTPGVAIPGVSPVTVTGAPEIASNPGADGGLFGGSNVIFSQLSYKASDSLDLGLIYARSYHSQGTGVSGLNGSAFANNPFGSANNAAGTGLRPTSANHFSLLASSKISPGFVLSGWVSYANAIREGAGGSADIWDAAITAAFPNFGAKGNVLGFVFGLPPKLTGNSAVATRVDRDTAIHLEAFYKYQVNDNISITPGVAVILNPESNSTNPALYLGTVRTTFAF
jgi:Carbohydrate-selective porin, OprB family